MRRSGKRIIHQQESYTVEELEAGEVELEDPPPPAEHPAGVIDEQWLTWKVPFERWLHSDES